MQIFIGCSDEQKIKNEKYPLEMFVFIVHGLFVTLFCIFFVYTQVSTRLLCSASPLLYWYCALTTIPKMKCSASIKQLEYETPDNLFSKWKVFLITEKQYTTAGKWIL